MRSIWMASAAALFMTTGLACAQTSTTSPSPDGSVAAPSETPPGGAPGTTAPSSQGTAGSGMSGGTGMDNGSGQAGSTGTGMSGGTSSGMSGSTGSGMNGSTGSGMNGSTGSGMNGGSGMGSSGATGSDGAASGMGTGSSGMGSGAAGPQSSNAHPWHRMGGSKSLPENASATAYLDIAKSAISAHNYSQADEALSRAETRLLTRAVDQSNPSPVDNSPAVTSIQQARAALRAHDSANALQATESALQQASAGGDRNGMSSGMNGGMNGGMNTDQGGSASHPGSMRYPNGSSGAAVPPAT